MTEAQQATIDAATATGKLSWTKRDYFDRFAEVKRLSDSVKQRPTGGRRNMYIHALTLMDGVGFLVLNKDLFKAPMTSLQAGFARVAKEHNRSVPSVWEHPDGTRVVTDYASATGEFEFIKWNLKKDGFTSDEVREMTQAWLTEAGEIVDEPILDEFISDTLDAQAADEDSDQ